MALGEVKRVVWVPHCKASPMRNLIAAAIMLQFLGEKKEAGPSDASRTQYRSGSTERVVADGPTVSAIFPR
jgi:hypothetical protein